MSPPPRRLSFAVGTSLLTASLAVGGVGCKDDGHKTANPKPDEEPVNVNVAYVEDDPQPEVDEPVEDPHVNTQPER